ncbi:uncharacterized protein G2W53_003222 [Senna tora]|uniref:Uncharacterized protein n=1 Tax=Senna tora TaxID=362788 RepID=A0A834X9R9_9FABA|nr:uncharacterized protein G2W53_003222 [Senna tora]
MGTREPIADKLNRHSRVTLQYNFPNSHVPGNFQTIENALELRLFRTNPTPRAKITQRQVSSPSVNICQNTIFDTKPHKILDLFWALPLPDFLPHIHIFKILFPFDEHVRRFGAEISIFAQTPDRLIL